MKTVAIEYGGFHGSRTAKVAVSDDGEVDLPDYCSDVECGCGGIFWGCTTEDEVPKYLDPYTKRLYPK